MAVNLKPGYLPVLKTYKGLIATAFLLCVFSGFGQSVFFGIYLEEIQSRLSINNTLTGSIYASATIASAFLMIWTGKLLDVMPLRQFILLVLGGLAAGCLCMAFSVNLALLFFAFLLLRIFGQGLMVLSGTTAVNRYIEEGRGRAQSLAQTGLPVHAALFPVAGIVITNLLGFQNSWLAYATFIICVLMPVFWLLLKDHEERTHKAWKEKIDADTITNQLSGVTDQWTRAQVLGDWRFYLLMMVMVIPPCFGTAVFFYQSVIAENAGMTGAVFAGGFIFMTIASVAGALLAGTIVDHYGEKVLLASFPVFYAGGLIFLGTMSSVFMVYAGLCLLGFGGGVMSITGGPLFAKMYGTKNYGSIKSLSVMAMIIASAVSPPLTGLLLDSNIGIQTVLLFFAIYAGLAWLLMLIFMKHITEQE